MDANAADGIVEFLRDRPPEHLAGVEDKEEITLLDAISAGSNRDGVLGILDGDPATYWEPAPSQMEPTSHPAGGLRSIWAASSSSTASCCASSTAKM